MMKAQAVVFEEINQVVFRAVETPDPGPRDVVVRVRHSWISSGTEGSVLRGERWGGDVAWHPGDPPIYPCVPGYQKTGIVEWVGPEVSDIQVGEWVFAAVSRVDGMTMKMGGHVSPAVTPRDSVWKLPAEVTPEEASGLVLTQVGYNCGTRAPIAPGDRVLVLGDGLVGQWAAQTAAWRGARVILAGHHDGRLAQFRAAGATPINTGREDLLARVPVLAPQGLAVVIDTVGTASTLDALIPLIRHDGHIVTAGFCGTEGLIDIQRLRLGEKTLHAPSGWSQRRMDDTLELLALDKLDAASLISHRLPADQAAEAWDWIRNRRNQVMGVVLQWPG
jgi:2-desacetyl-2-hydroxyethyl bacteriochlorophyllide A dehydrogenase